MAKEMNEDNSRIDALLVWKRKSTLNFLLFYFITSSLTVCVSLLLTADFGNFDWSKDFRLPFVFAFFVSISLELYSQWRQILKRFADTVTKLSQIEASLQSVSLRLKVGNESYYEMILQSDFAEAFAKLIHRKNARDLCVIEYEGESDRIVRQLYLNDLQKFIKCTQHSYVTIQPTLGWFNSNFWFFRTFNESVKCTRIVMYDTAKELVAVANEAKQLSDYVYETGQHTKTLWILKQTCVRLVNTLPIRVYERFQQLPFSILEAINHGDLVICDNRVLIHYAEIQAASARKSCKATMTFFLLDNDLRDSVSQLVKKLAPENPPIVNDDEKAISEETSVFRLAKLEEISKKGYYRPLTQKQSLFSLSSIEENAVLIENRLKHFGTPRWVVKANCYGVGAAKIVSRLYGEYGFKKFAVESVESLVDLRGKLLDLGEKNWDQLDMLVLEPIQPEQIKPLLEASASCFAWTRSQLETLNDECVNLLGELGKAKVHLKARLGVNRFGTECSNLSYLFEYAKSLKNIQVVGLAGHHHKCRPSTEIDEWDNEFNEAVSECKKLADPNEPFPVVHTRSSGSMPSNSTEKRQWNEEFRIGGALYGVFPNAEVREFFLKKGWDVKQVLKLRGRIEAFVRIKPGETVSYGGNVYSKPTEGVIGWLNLGYYDGLPAIPSGQFIGQYRGVMCRSIGVIGMDYLAVDVTEVFNNMDEKEQHGLFNGQISNQENILIFDDSSPELTVERLASACSIPSYSLLTGIGQKRQTHGWINPD